ncbi:long-chain fatty alcohol dehydrogenase [Daldinia loculata]|nr:long-chain fatty alcohol dehydrogenase [Daldinia loculata]
MELEKDFPRPQWHALLSLLDATVPPILVSDSSSTHDDYLYISQEEFDRHYHDIRRRLKHPPSKTAFQEYLAARPSDNPTFVKCIRKTIGALSPGPRMQLYRALGLMMTRLGSLISTGYFTPFNRQSVTVREAILRSWRSSWLFIWTMLGRTFVQLGTMTWSQTDPLFHGLSDYVADPHSEPGPTIDFNFMNFDATPEPIHIETGIVIVGSGCGGGVCAKVLAEAGYRVLVVDKGYYMPPNQLPVGADSTELLFEGESGGLSTVDGSVVIAAGSCWGGGGTVNWAVSLPPPDWLRKQWAEEKGLKFFSTSDFQNSIGRVCDFIGVDETRVIQHNHANRVLIEGSKKLGWSAKTCLANAAPGHNCGSRCGGGCRQSKKQGPAVSWLPAAVKAGARCIEGFEVSQVLFEDNGGSKNAVGIVGKWTSRDKNGNFKSVPKSEVRQRQVHVRAKKVIIAGGTLNTPLILLRSNLKNPNIGKNLHLHPANSISAVFDEDIRGWEGDIISSVVTEFEDLDGKGHGPRIETTSMLPPAAIFQVPWHGGLQFKLDALKYRHMNCFMALIRDRDSGRVTPNPDDGSPVIAYTTSSFDRANLMVGLVAIAKICYMQGAIELLPMVSGLPCYRSDLPVHERTLDDADFAEWLNRLEAADLSSSSDTFGSAHQMGSCCMSTSPTTGVVNEDGKVWDTENLYVADASVFPSGSGVNPMITVMAIADHIARGISKQM